MTFKDEANKINLLSPLNRDIFFIQRKENMIILGIAKRKKDIVAGGRSKYFTKAPVEPQMIAAIITSKYGLKVI